jgi:hypothetical protein
MGMAASVGSSTQLILFYAELRCQFDSVESHKSIYDKNMTFEGHNLIDVFMAKIKRML